MLNENKQVKAANGGGTLGEYWYDGDGKRVKKTTNTSDNVIFIYDAGGRLIEERSSSSPYTLLTSYVYAGGRLISTETSSGTKYLTTDHLGSPRINTDGSGNVVARHDYHPFGEEIDGSGGRTTGLGYQADGVRKQFTGYERDIETDLDYAQARMYGNSHGRFTSPDPYKIVAEVRVEQDREKAAAMLYRYISRPQQWNQYVYTVNNPLKYTDPSGEKVDLTGETAEERAAALRRLRNILGEERFKLVTVSADGRSVSLSNENVAAFQKIGDNADNKDFSLGFAEILNSSQSVEFRVTDKFTNKNNRVIDLNTEMWGGALTVSGDDSSTGNIQIFVHPRAGEIATEVARRRGGMTGIVTPGTGNFAATNEEVDAHEFGHGWDRLRAQGPPAMGAKPTTPEGWKSFENAVRSRNPQNSQRRTKHH